MSLLLDALKRAEQAKRQQAAAGEVYPPLALQDEAQAAATPAPAAADVVPTVVPESPVESAFAGGRRCGSLRFILQRKWRINLASGSLLPLGLFGAFQRIQQQTHRRLVSR
jgi:hypothetical protein